MKTIVAPALVVLAWVAGTHLQAQSLRWLGTLGGGSSYAYGISADGAVVVGEATNADGNLRAFRWTAAGGMQDLGTLPGYDYNSLANDVSADGSIVVGRCERRDGQYRAFRWTAAEGMVELGTLGGAESVAMGISQVGSVIVGWADNEIGFSHAVRWTRSGAIEDLGTLGGAESGALDIASDGSIIVGWARDGNNLQHAFRWSQSGGMQDLGTLGGVWSRATGVSADGAVVVGWAGYESSSDNRHAFRWTAAGGMQDLGTLGGNTSEALGVSADGSVVVGWSRDAEGLLDRAFRWTAAGGLENLNETYASLLTDGSILQQATAVSSDGRYIVGWGWHGADAQRLEAYLLDTQGTSSAEESESGLAWHIFPTPAVGSVNIELSMTGAVAVRVRVYDALGREVARLHDGWLPAGRHRFVFEGARAGVYICRLHVGDRMEQRPMVVLW